MGKQKISGGMVFLLILLVLAGVLLLYTNSLNQSGITGHVVENSANCTNSLNCTENWQCGNWTACLDGNQTRTCTDSGNCNTTTCKPVELQSCTVETNTTTNCTENWQCADWGTCTDGNQTRTCNDSAACNTTLIKPVELQSCTCTENWQCDAWTDCSDGGQTRTCTDANLCGTTASKPEESQSCTVAENLNQNITEEIIQQPPVCTPSWQCGDWQECISGTQVRICTDLSSCGSEEGMPSTSQVCTPVVVSNETATPVKNQSKNFLSIIGSVIRVPIDAVFGNKTRIFIFSGAVVLVIAGFLAFKFFLKGKWFFKKKKGSAVLEVVE